MEALLGLIEVIRKQMFILYIHLHLITNKPYSPIGYDS